MAVRPLSSSFDAKRKGGRNLIQVRNVIFDGRFSPDREAPWNWKQPVMYEDTIIGIHDIWQNGNAVHCYDLDFSKNLGFLLKPKNKKVTVVIYVSSHGNLCKKEYCNEGVSHSLYRGWKPEITKEKKRKIREQMMCGAITMDEVFAYTESLGDFMLRQKEQQTIPCA